MKTIILKVLFSIFILSSISLTTKSDYKADGIELGKSLLKTEFTLKSESIKRIADNKTFYLEASKAIKKFEGFKSTVYKCPKGKETIGYGFTSKYVVSQKEITKEYADIILSNRIESERNFLREKISRKLNPYEEACLVSFCYNVGRYKFLKSRIYKNITSENYSKDLVSYELSTWVNVYTINSKGEKEKTPLKGLELRREYEIKLWNKEV